MIYIKQNSDNKFITRFNDKKTLANGYFLWEIENEFTGDIIYVSLDDTSPYPCAYNLFNLVHSTTGSTTGGTNVPLNLIPGQYEYRVYETTGQTLSISAATGSYIEKDMLVVEFARYVNSSAATNYDVYY